MVKLNEYPFYAELISADFGGSSELVFDGYGVPKSPGRIVVQHLRDAETHDELRAGNQSFQPDARGIPGAESRLGPDLSIVSVGEASREGDRGVRLPLVLGDAEGGTTTVVLTLQLDVLVDEDPG